MTSTTVNYRIGGHTLRISCDDERIKLDSLTASFRPFIIGEEEAEGEELLFHLHVVPRLKEVPKEHRRLIRDVDTGNGMTRVDRLEDGGYQFFIRDVFGNPCALLITSPKFDDCRCAIRGSHSTRRFALNNALMLTYAFSAAYRDTLLIHASVVRHNGNAYAFTAKSGTGKSTQVANWLRNIEGCDMMNDDNPIIRIVDGKAMLYGSPWSGKTPCYRNVSAQLGAIVLIERDKTNFVAPMEPLQAFTTLLGACSSMKWDEVLYQSICTTVSQFVEKIKVVSLHCLPDAESALVCCNTLEGNETA